MSSTTRASSAEAITAKAEARISSLRAAAARLRSLSNASPAPQTQAATISNPAELKTKAAPVSVPPDSDAPGRGATPRLALTNAKRFSAQQLFNDREAGRHSRDVSRSSLDSSFSAPAIATLAAAGASAP